MYCTNKRVLIVDVADCCTHQCCAPGQVNFDEFRAALGHGEIAFRNYQHQQVQLLKKKKKKTPTSIDKHKENKIVLSIS